MLILWGERDAVFGRADQGELASLLPAAHVMHFLEAGHALNTERAEEVAAAMRAFLEGTGGLSATYW
jgi:pimeloyl-ACP methyl ester carboxylesterase